MIGNLRIKVCGLTRVEDGHLALQLGADYLGVILYKKSPRMAPEHQARLLANSFPVGKRVCVDVSPTPSKLEGHGDLGFDHFQIHCPADTPRDTLQAWSDVVGKDRLWLAPRIGPNAPFPAGMLHYADTILLDSYDQNLHGGTGLPGDWGKFAATMDNYPDTRFILAGGLNPQNVREALRTSGARIIDVNSGVEESPGVKSHHALTAFFSALTA